MNAVKDKAEDEYVWHFEMPNFLWFPLIIFGMSYVSLLAYMPSVIPFESLGPLGDLSVYLLKNYELLVIMIFWFAWAAHILEAIYVVKLGHSYYIHPACLNLWFFQTFLVGYASTYLMRRYVKQLQKRE